jgi:hypothetical protein
MLTRETMKQRDTGYVIPRVLKFKFEIRIQNSIFKNMQNLKMVPKVNLEILKS